MNVNLIEITINKIINNTKIHILIISMQSYN